MRRFAEVFVLVLSVLLMCYGFVASIIFKFQHWDLTEIGMLVNYPGTVIWHFAIAMAGLTLFTVLVKHARRI